jgi:hypothetical protein
VCGGEDTLSHSHSLAHTGPDAHLSSLFNVIDRIGAPKYSPPHTHMYPPPPTQGLTLISLVFNVIDRIGAGSLNVPAPLWVIAFIKVSSFTHTHKNPPSQGVETPPDDDVMW